jgi:hypothetical protein
MIDGPGLIRGSRTLSSKPTTISNENHVHDLCDFLEDPDRRLPVFVSAIPNSETTSRHINDTLLAKATAGMARVFCVTEAQTYVITQRFGKFFSVFNGGVRAYMPGFSSADDPFNHRLFLAANLKDREAAAACVRILRLLAARVSISENRLGTDILDFGSMRTASRKLKKDSLTKSAAPDDEMLAIAEELVLSLEKQVEEKEKDIDGYLDEVEATELRAQNAEHENRSLLFKVRRLETLLEESEKSDAHQVPLPTTWDTFADWLDQTYPDKVLLTPSARRMVKSPQFEDVALVARAIVWLATIQHERRIKGGGRLRDETVESGILNASCGGDTYSVQWKDRSYDVNWHIKNGGNTRDPKKCLRIYYFWEPELNQTVIDALPAHRRTSMT